jgi:hypothetical protein
MPAVRGGVPLAVIIIGLVLIPVVYSLYLWMRERAS